jgi:hypothetical protein
VRGHALFFDDLVELVPAKFYVPADRSEDWMVRLPLAQPARWYFVYHALYTSTISTEPSHSHTRIYAAEPTLTDSRWGCAHRGISTARVTRRRPRRLVSSTRKRLSGSR